MDLRRAPFLGGLALVFVACEGQLLTLTLREEATTMVPRGTLVEGLLDDLGFDDLIALDLTQSEELANQGVEPGDITSVYLTAFHLAVVSPEGVDLSFLDSLEVSVSAPGLPEVRVASGDDFPAGAAEVELEVEDVDLADYVVSRSMTLRTDVIGRRPEEDTTVKASFALRVGVTGQGACNALDGD